MAIVLVGVPRLDQNFDHGYHLNDMGRRARFDIGLQGAHFGHVLVEGLGRPRRDRLDGFAGIFGRGDNLVVHIGNVANIGDARIKPFEKAVEHVEDHDRTRVADMGEVVNCRPADIEPHPILLQRFEFLLGAAQRIVKMKGHGFLVVVFLSEYSVEVSRQGGPVCVGVRSWVKANAYRGPDRPR